MVFEVGFRNLNHLGFPRVTLSFSDALLLFCSFSSFVNLVSLRSRKSGLVLGGILNLTSTV